MDFRFSEEQELFRKGGDIVTQMILARELARSLAGLTWAWGITSFAGGKSVGIYGTPEQKQQYLPAIAAGREKWAIGFTEPGGGTEFYQPELALDQIASMRCTIVLAAFRDDLAARGQPAGLQRP